MSRHAVGCLCLGCCSGNLARSIERASLIAATYPDQSVNVDELANLFVTAVAR